MSKRIIIIAAAIVCVLILIAIGVLVGVHFLNSANPSSASEYSAVYLTSGDIYFGKLDWFPWPRLKDVWFIQRSADQSGQAQLSVAALKNAFWGPVDEIYLNPKEIIFWTKLRNDSQIVQALQNPASIEPLPAQAQNGQPQSGLPAAPSSGSAGQSTAK